MPLPPITQAKNHLLKILAGAHAGISEIHYPCLPEDRADFEAALALPDVQRAFSERGVTAKICPVKQTPDIVIATVDDVASGKLDQHFPR